MMNTIVLLFLIPGWFLLSFILTSIIPGRYSSAITFAATVLALLSCVTAVAFRMVATGVVAAGVEWFHVGGHSVHAGIWMDHYNSSLILTVSIVSFLVHLYSIRYMAGEPAIRKYFAQLGLFTFAMLGLIMSSNLLLTFCFWELIGFCSYQLISHWQEKVEASAAATKAFIMNRVGDLGFVTGLMILWSFGGDLDIAALQYISFSGGWQTAAGLCLFLGVVGKSAQFPLFTWLPDAMEGPTPVSALIHAATLVAAGVFLLFRLHFLFTPDALAVVALTGSVTAVLGAVAALFQYDIKRILAYSTISQLGFMVMAMVSAEGVGGFHHLLNHAFFKAGLFLCAGSIIHALHRIHTADGEWDVQDIRNLGGLRKHLPVTFYCFVICSAALAGIPFTSGFISKEIILADISMWAGNGAAWRWIIPAAGWLVTFLTPLYTFRLVYYVFLGDQNQRCSSAKESPVIMLVPMILLSVASLAITIGVHYSINSWVLASHASAVQWIVFTSLLIISLAVVVGYWIYRAKPSVQYGSFLTHNFLIDKFYATSLLKPIRSVAVVTTKMDGQWLDRCLHGWVYLSVGLSHLVAWLDKMVIDGFVNGLAWVVSRVGSVTRSIAGGKIQSYLLWAIAGLVIFITLILF